MNLYKIQPIYSKINIHAHSEKASFSMAYCNEHMHIIKYLLSCGYYSNNYKCINIIRI